MVFCNNRSVLKKLKKKLQRVVNVRIKKPNTLFRYCLTHFENRPGDVFSPGWGWVKFHPGEGFENNYFWWFLNGCLCIIFNLAQHYWIKAGKTLETSEEIFFFFFTWIWDRVSEFCFWPYVDISDCNNKFCWLAGDLFCFIYLYSFSDFMLHLRCCFCLFGVRIFSNSFFRSCILIFVFFANELEFSINFESFRMLFYFLDFYI
jgi:hypothetical protein